MRDLNTFIKFILALIVSELAGVIGSVATVSSIPTWYANLAKSELNPPNVVFGPVWIVLYALMGTAFFLVWKMYPAALPAKKFKQAVFAFFMQLIVNVLWSIIFFGLRGPSLAFFDILLLWLAIAYMITVFYRISKVAAYLLFPYLLWVTFAVYLNYAILALN